MAEGWNTHSWMDHLQGLARQPQKKEPWGVGVGLHGHTPIPGPEADDGTTG